VKQPNAVEKGVDWLWAPEYVGARTLVVRGVALIYLIGFTVAFNQFPALLGEHGLQPAPRFIAGVPFKRSPSLFYLRYSDTLLRAVAVVGMVLSALGLAGLLDHLPVYGWILVWLLLWVFYLSIVNIGQTFYGFGWESLLCEVGFLIPFLGPASIAPPIVVIFMLRWVLFRLEFGAGLIKMRGDPCWRDLTCLYYHHETQPMPNPLSWYFHHLPKVLHRAEVGANHFVQLVVPFALFAPQPIATVAGILVIVTQGWLVLSGNFAWLNALTIILAFSALSGGFVDRILPGDPVPATGEPVWFGVVVLVLLGVILLLSYRPARNLFARRQLMNYSFDPLHLVNTYGAFGSITRVRNEIVFEATIDPEPSPASDWREYIFKGKPGDTRKLPPQFAPYHLRLDWLMWFVGISATYAGTWFAALAVKFLEADPQTLKLIRSAPFDEPPTAVRALTYRYRFTTRAERKASGEWWHRELVGVFLPPMTLHGRRRGASNINDLLSG
jgi:Lipase maturation factor